MYTYRTTPMARKVEERAKALAAAKARAKAFEARLAALDPDGIGKAVIAECKDNAMSSLPPLAFEYAPRLATPLQSPVTRQAIANAATYRNGPRGEGKEQGTNGEHGASVKLVDRARLGHNTKRYVRWFHADDVEYRLVSISAFHSRAAALRNKIEQLNVKIDKPIPKAQLDKLLSLRQRTIATLHNLLREHGGIV